MLTPEDDDAVGMVTRVLQILVGTMVAGLLMFLAVILTLRSQQSRPAAEPQQGFALPVISVTAFVVAGTVVPLSLIVPGVFAESACKRIAAGKWTEGMPKGWSDARELLSVYQTRTIIAAALAEGPAFLALVAYFLEGTPYALGLAIALIGLVAWRFPRREAVAQWVEDMLVAVEMMRH